MSVIVVAGEQRERAGRCLRSILAQGSIDSLEVLILDCVTPGVPPLDGSDHPRVRLVPLSPDTLYATARAEGIRRARGPIVAFVEEHCIVLPGWAQAVLRAHEDGWGGVGSEVHNGNAGVGISDTVALIYFAPWLPPAGSAESELLPGHNSSYQRDLLLSFAERLELLLRNEPILQWELAKNGHRFLLEPEAKLAHANETTPRDFAKAYFAWHRCFGHTRAQVFGWSTGKKVAYVTLSPVLPWARVAKLLGFLMGRRPDLVGEFFRGLPVVVLGYLVSTVAQAVGIWFGLGDAERQFTYAERNWQRAMPPGGKQGSGHLG